MINGAYLARRTGEHLNIHYGFRSRQVRFSDESVSLGGIEFIFEVGKKEGGNRYPFKVKVVPPANEDGFSRHMDSIQNPKFWENSELSKLRQNMNDYRKFLDGDIKRAFDKNDESYIFEGVLTTNNDSHAFFTLFNHIVKPTWLYRRYNPLT